MTFTQQQQHNSFDRDISKAGSNTRKYKNFFFLNSLRNVYQIRMRKPRTHHIIFFLNYNRTGSVK
jgi:hypothetical protein